MIDKLINKFNKLYPGYHMELDRFNSYKRCYYISVTEPVCGLTSEYIFSSLHELREWINGVVID